MVPYRIRYRAKDKAANRRRYTCHTRHQDVGCYRAPLLGRNLVRLAFLDESGRSRREPIIVVAGVIIHGDRAYRSIEDHLLAMVQRHIPENDQYGFVFHATDLFHGSGYFKRDRWPKPVRWLILEELAGITKRFSLPVIYGLVNKAQYKIECVNRALPPVDRDDQPIIERAEHMTAFGNAEMAIDRQMHQYPSDEICALICEDTDLVKKAVKSAHEIMRAKSKTAEVFAKFFGWTKQPWFPLKKIVDTPHFASKSDSSLLQIADLCSFLIMRRLNRKEDSQVFFEIIAPQLSWRAEEFGERMGQEQIGVGPRH